MKYELLLVDGYQTQMLAVFDSKEEAHATKDHFAKYNGKDFAAKELFICEISE